ncbi:MAG: hypothetical protein JWR80_5839 [Bradyrhizobium sp.]|nr:hypothetical protein [Bradyrhizobium sp.]
MPDKAFEDPSRTTSIDGEVVVIGPGKVGLSMTPAAAQETGRRLKAAAKLAKTQERRDDEAG